MKQLILLGCICLMTACGGGGGGSDSDTSKTVVPPEQRWDNVTWSEMKWR